jgi:hypothetical protein
MDERTIRGGGGFGYLSRLASSTLKSGGLQFTARVAVLILRLSLAAYQGNNTAIGSRLSSTPIVLQGAWWRCKRHVHAAKAEQLRMPKNRIP